MGVSLKTVGEMRIMEEGGKRLARIKAGLREKVRPGVSAMEIEREANKLIAEAGGKPSFKMVPKYKWATCVNVNEGVVHGVPKKEIVFKKGDIVSVDVGLFYKGFHTDTAFSVLLGEEPEKKAFWETGRRALAEAIGAVKDGGQIGDISRAIGGRIRGDGYRPVESLTGHGVGRELHEDPRIPCLELGTRDEQMKIRKGMTLAVEVMYVMGAKGLVLGDDGWTISTRDGKIAALFEETVAVTPEGTKVLTT